MSECRPPTEAKQLRTVDILPLGDRVREIEPQGSEGRGPDEAHANRGVDEHVISTWFQTFTGGSRKWQEPACRPLVVPERARVRKRRNLHTALLGQEIKRCLDLDTGTPIHAAAKGIVQGANGKVTRPNAGWRKA